MQSYSSKCILSLYNKNNQKVIKTSCFRVAFGFDNKPLKSKIKQLFFHETKVQAMLLSYCQAQSQSIPIQSQLGLRLALLSMSDQPPPPPHPPGQVSEQQYKQLGIWALWALWVLCVLCVCKVSGMYLEGVWNVSGRCLEGNWSLTLLLCGLVLFISGQYISWILGWARQN